MEPGVVLSGRYRLERRLGRGGMGEVWTARDRELHRTVAIKIVLAGMDTDPGLIARLRREARTAGALQHPGITVVHDVGEHEGRPYFVMELLEGQDFAALLEEHPGGLPVDLTVKLMAQVAEALDHAHRRGVVHRDLKPANLMRLSGDKVKVCDFGIARYADASAHRLTPITPAGGVLGTPPFMAPEQWRGEPADAATDLYAFGVTLHVLLAGTPPFPGPTQAAFVHQHLNTPPPHLGDLRPDIPAELTGLVQQLLAKKPTDRTASALQVRDALLDLFSHHPSTTDGRRTHAQPPQPLSPDLQRHTPPSSTTTISVPRRDLAWQAFLLGSAVIIGLFLFLGVMGWALGAAIGSGSGPLDATKILKFVGWGAALGIPIGVVNAVLNKPVILTLDSEGLTVAEGTKQWSVRWDSLERIAIAGKGSKAALVVWFHPSHRPAATWIAENHIQARSDDSYAIYRRPATDFARVRVERLRDVLPLYAGHLYDATHRDTGT
ncbi:serine/threonine-protein kinase [Streptomyces sp. NPDC050485]|uniref:serine/threonine-protein kinase n=1 Tax=Streptomyces sp. NPDC050485 TaxID=3365617 RepID=UPI003794EC77